MGCEDAAEEARWPERSADGALKGSLAVTLEALLRQEPAILRYLTEVWPPMAAEPPGHVWGDPLEESGWECLTALLKQDDLDYATDAGRVREIEQRGAGYYHTPLFYEAILDRARAITEAWNCIRRRPGYVPFVLAYEGCKQALEELLEALRKAPPNPTTPARCTGRSRERILAKLNVEVLDPDRVELRCTECGRCWSPNLQEAGRLPRGYWRAPCGCNAEACENLASCGGGDR